MQLAAVSGDGDSTVAVAIGALSERVPSAVGLSVQHCSTGPGPILCTMLFCNYLNFAHISKCKMKTIPMSKIIETFMVLELILLNNFSHFVNFQFSTELKL
jgi:hypothetical protein